MIMPQKILIYAQLRNELLASRCCWCGASVLAAGDLALCLVSDSADGLLATLPCAGIGLGPLSAGRETTAVAKPAIGVYRLEAADVSSDHSAEVALDHIVILQYACDGGEVFVRQLVGLCAGFDLRLLDDFHREGRPDPVNVTQGVFDTLLAWNVNSDDAWHNAPLFSLRKP